MLSEQLTKLYNTLNLIETKGENTKIMAQCLVFTDQLIGEVRASEIENAKEPDIDEEKEEAKQ